MNREHISNLLIQAKSGQCQNTGRASLPNYLQHPATHRLCSEFGDEQQQQNIKINLWLIAPLSKAIPAIKRHFKNQQANQLWTIRLRQTSFAQGGIAIPETALTSPPSVTQRFDVMFLHPFIKSICYQLNNFFWNVMAGAGFNSPAMCLSAFSYLPSMDMSALLLGKPIITAQNTWSMHPKAYTTRFVSVVTENCSKMTTYVIRDYRNTTELHGTNLFTMDVCPR